MSDFEIGGRGYVLAWPREALSAELIWLLQSGSNREDARFLLQEAFAATDPVDALDSLSADGWGAANTVRDFLRALLGAVDDLPTASERPRAYWAQRHGRALPGSAEDKTTSSTSEWAGDPLGRLKASWVRVVQDLAGRGYLDHAAPGDCVDAPRSQPSQHLALEDEIEKRLGLGKLWPLDPQRLEDDDTFYSLVEVIGDLVARPRSRHYHDFADCGWHYSGFNSPTGQSLYRSEVNNLLVRNGSHLRLALDGEDEGLLVHIAGDDRDDLVANVLSAPHEQDLDELRHAVASFRARDADRAAKRSAVVTLARLLEDRRALLKAELLSKDEGALFQIANQFDLRHRNPQQRGDYDDAFLDWVFWFYLSTIELSDRLIQGRGDDASR